MSVEVLPFPRGEQPESAEHLPVKSPERFYDRIGMLSLKDRLTTQNPQLYFTMEIYRHDLRGQGGLGMLAADIAESAEKQGVPMVFVTPFYPLEAASGIDKDFWQHDVVKVVHPEERGFKLEGEASIRTLGPITETPLSIYTKQEGSVRLVTLYEPGLGKLYSGSGNDEHRLYQETVLGFGGYKALKELGIGTAGKMQINEGPAIMAALARLSDIADALKERGGEVNMKDALKRLKKEVVYTNHTLVPAVEGNFSGIEYDKYVIPNINNKDVKDWLLDQVMQNGGTLDLTTLAMKLSGKKAGVSKIHARESSKSFSKRFGEEINFDPDTNGVSIARWGDPKLVASYREKGILDEFDLPSEDYMDRMAELDGDELAAIKKEGKHRMIKALKERKDQYGEPIDIPEDAMVLNWRRRIAGYKRPGMMFEDPNRLSEILERQNMHIVMSGKAHADDNAMKSELQRILHLVDQHPILNKYVHFVQDYDENVARVLVQGSDLSINTPTVWNDDYTERISTEACGTSWEKDILNNGILISTEDGGVADLSIGAEQAGITNFRPPYLRIKGRSYKEEVDSMYALIDQGADIVKDREKWAGFVVRQTAGFLPIIADARMIRDNLRTVYGEEELQAA